MLMDLYSSFFSGAPRRFMLRTIDLALAEDGEDLTSVALFPESDLLTADIVAKEHMTVAGLPLAPLILERCAAGFAPQAPYSVELLRQDGARVTPGDLLLQMQGQARLLLKAERVILNFLCHLSGIATLTRQYANALAGSRTRLLDTRKTLPGLRYPEKYAVLVGGGHNHRKNLEEMLMLKDNHIDQAGSIQAAVEKLRTILPRCPPIEVECRDASDVDAAVAAGVERIMLDNMTPEGIAACLKRIPAAIETEISGGVDLDNLILLGSLGADFISVGRITHSARSMDISMRIATPAPEPIRIHKSPEAS
jgi:nicotinate-nucleotide pyrophosphorylase (carboxylating)